MRNSNFIIRWSSLLVLSDPMARYLPCTGARVSISTTPALISRGMMRIELHRGHHAASYEHGAGNFHDPPPELNGFAAAEVLTWRRELLSRLTVDSRRTHFERHMRVRRTIDFKVRLVEILANNPRRVRNYLLQFLQPPPDDNESALPSAASPALRMPMITEASAAAAAAAAAPDDMLHHSAAS